MPARAVLGRHPQELTQLGDMTDDQAPSVGEDHHGQHLEAERIELRLRGRVVMHVLLDVRDAMTREEILRLSTARSAVMRIHADLFAHLAHLPPIH